MHRGPPQQSQVADREQNAQLGGAHLEIGDFEIAQRIGSQINLNGEHEISNEKSQSDGRGHVSGEAEAAEKKESAESVYDVVNIKTVARTRMVAKAGQSAIERVTQPVERQAENDQKQSGAIGGGPPVSNAGASHGEQAQQGEMVRVDPGGCARCQPDQGAFFQIGEEALLYPSGFTKARVASARIASVGDVEWLSS